jgi:hypothetical protein
MIKNHLNIDCLSCSNLAEEIIEDVMLIIFIYIYKLIICKIQIINCKGAYRNAEWGERPADTGPGMEMYPAICGYVPGMVYVSNNVALYTLA